MGRPAVLDQSAFEPGQTGLSRRGSGRFVDDDVVVVDVGHRATPVAVDPHRQLAECECLEVEHQVAPDQRVVEARQQQEPRRLHGPSGDDHHVAAVSVWVSPSRVDALDAGGPAVGHDDPRHERSRPRSSARPVSSARRRSATGSPLAWIGQPKKAQKPQLLQAGRPS